MAVSLPGSAIRSRESGQRILGGSISARREERESGNLWVLGLGCESRALALALSHPRDAVHSPGTPEPVRPAVKAPSAPIPDERALHQPLPWG